MATAAEAAYEPTEPPRPWDRPADRRRLLAFYSDQYRVSRCPRYQRCSWGTSQHSLLRRASRSTALSLQLGLLTDILWCPQTQHVSTASSLALCNACCASTGLSTTGVAHPRAGAAAGGTSLSDGQVSADACCSAHGPIAARLPQPPASARHAELRCTCGLQGAVVSLIVGCIHLHQQTTTPDLDHIISIQSTPFLLFPVFDAFTPVSLELNLAAGLGIQA